MIRFGIGEDEEDEEEGRHAARVWSARPVPALPTSVSLPSLLPLKSPLTTSASASVAGGSLSGSKHGAGGVGDMQQQLMGKAEQLMKWPTRG